VKYLSVDNEHVTCGGGGHEDVYSSGGEGGSGYLEYRSLKVSSFAVLTAQLGDLGQPSSVNLDTGDSITAHPGRYG